MATTVSKSLSAALVLSVVAAAAAAAALAPADAIALRQARMKDLGASFKTLNDELRGDTPDMGKVKASVALMNKTGQELPAWFPAGSGPDAGIKTHAKAEVWSDAAGFANAAKGFATETAKLQAMADSGDTDALSVQAKVVGQTCGTCHSTFRGKDG
jgi:cytochrome c556